MSCVQSPRAVPEPAILRDGVVQAGIVAQRNWTMLRQQMEDDRRQRTSTTHIDDRRNDLMRVARPSATTSSMQIESRGPSISTPLSPSSDEVADRDRVAAAIANTESVPLALVGPQLPTSAAQPMFLTRKRSRSRSGSVSMERKRMAMGDEAQPTGVPSATFHGPDTLGSQSLAYAISMSPATPYTNPASCAESPRNATRTPPPRLPRQELRGRSCSPRSRASLLPTTSSGLSAPRSRQSNATGTPAGDKSAVRQALPRKIVTQEDTGRGGNDDQTSDDDTVVFATPLWGSPTTPNTPSTVPTTPGSGTRSNTPARVRSPTFGRLGGIQIPGRGGSSVPVTPPHGKERRSEKQKTCHVVDDREESPLASAPQSLLTHPSTPEQIHAHQPPRDQEDHNDDAPGASESQRQWGSSEQGKAPQKLVVSTPFCLPPCWSPVVEEDDEPVSPALSKPASTTPQLRVPHASDQTDASTSEQTTTSASKDNPFPMSMSPHHENGGSHQTREVEDQAPEDEQDQVVYPEDPSVNARKIPTKSLKKNGGLRADLHIGNDQPNDTKHIKLEDNGETGKTGCEGKVKPLPVSPAPQPVQRAEDASPPKSEPPTPPPSTPPAPIIASTARQNSHESQALFASLHGLPTGVPSAPKCSSNQHLQSVLQSHPHSSTYPPRVDNNAFFPRHGQDGNQRWQPERITGVAPSRTTASTTRSRRLRLNGLVPGRPEDAADRERAISVASSKTNSTDMQRSRRNTAQTSHVGPLDVSSTGGGVPPVSPELSPGLPPGPSLADGKLYTFPEIQKLKERERKFLKRSQPISGNAAVANAYPFVDGYTSDIGSDINSLDARPFAGGAFGNIRRGFLNDGRQVAIKFLRSGVSKLEKKLLKEIRVWSLLEHENVLPLLGLCVVNNELGMVSEYMSNGNIKVYIGRNPDVDRYWLAIHVCAGLAYLHEHPKHVVHGDLKAVNVVVDDNGIPKLVDFGLAKTIRAEDSTDLSSSSSVGGTARWMARELIVADPPNSSCPKPNSASDVYSLGMTIYEMFSGTLPFASCKRDPQVIAVIIRGELPERTPGVFTDGLWELLLQCWQQDPSKRPTAREVLAALEDLRHI